LPKINLPIRPIAPGEKNLEDEQLWLRQDFFAHFEKINPGLIATGMDIACSHLL